MRHGMVSRRAVHGVRYRQAVREKKIGYIRISNCSTKTNERLSRLTRKRFLKNRRSQTVTKMDLTSKDLKEIICPICGRTFIPAPCHVFHVDGKPYKKVCSWTCLCESRRRDPKLNTCGQGRAKQVIKYDAEGNEVARYNTIREAARARGIQPATMSSYIWQNRTMKDGSVYRIIEKDW